MAKKDDVTTYTKAELIKALRASVAREAKLQKRITRLEELLRDVPIPPDEYLAGVTNAAGACTGRVTHVEPGEDTISELTRHEPYDGVPHDTDVPTFPWEQK